MHENRLNAPLLHLHLSDPRGNQWLATLPDAEWAHWQPHVEPLELRAGQVLIELGRTPSHLVFPITAIVSVVCRTQDGASAEIAVVGSEGLVGVSLFMGGNAAPREAVVQSPGSACRLPARAVRDAVDDGGPMLTLLLRYTQSLMTQVTQTAVCNRHHSIQQQLCRRLLMGLDRSPTNELTMTQESVAGLLGVRREGVSAAALELQQSGVIRYRRGHIVVLDRARLEARACECYAVAKKECDRLLPKRTHPAMPCRSPSPYEKKI